MNDLSRQPRDALMRMVAAGERILECYRVLKKTQDNVVGELLRGQGEFFEWDHYPKGDIYDHVTHSQYYYHAHPTELRGGEHGHFHTFLRPKGMPSGIAPAPLPDLELPEDEDDALSHLIAISMNPAGYPIRLFTTNRWVTGEVWYVADDVIRMLDDFAIDLARPSWPANLWVSDMLRLFRPQTEVLIRRRDDAVAAWREGYAGSDVYEDRDFEIASSTSISVEAQMRRLREALKAKDTS